MYPYHRANNLVDMIQDSEISTLRHQVTGIQSRLDNLVSENTVSHQIQLHLSNILSNQNYFQSALQKQQQTFQTMSDNHQNKYDNIETNMIQELEDASNDIITETIKKISSQDYVMNDMSNNIMTHTTKQITDNTKNIYNNMWFCIIISNIIVITIGVCMYVN